MPSEKSRRVAERRAAHNRAVRSAIRTAYRKAVGAAVEGAAQPEALVKEAVSQLDRAARKRVIHPNRAARQKSQLMRAARAGQAKSV